MATYEAYIPDEGRRKDNADKFELLKQLFYNPTKHEIFGRNQGGWVRFLLFYFGLYWLLTIMLIVLLAFALVAMDDIEPFRTGMDSPLKNSPGLAMRPVPDMQGELIRFVQGKPESYKPFTDHIQTFLEQYENEAQVGENFIDCDEGRRPDSLMKVCRFKVDKLGNNCTWQRDYGYDEGQPCVLFKLNKIYGWEADTHQPSDQPPEIGDRFEADHVGLFCDGEYAADRENIGNLTYSPEIGFPKFFYPFLNQEGYRSPLVMVRFDNPVNGVVINVLCKALARNIAHDRNDQIGMVRFQLLVD